MNGDNSTHWSFSGVLVRLYATVCETSSTLPNLEEFLEQYKHIDPRQHADVLLFDQFYRWRNGTQRPAEWYLERFPKLEFNVRWRLELILEEFGYREDAGNPATVQEFLDRFPQYAEQLSHLLPYTEEHKRFSARAELLARPFHGNSLATTRFMDSTIDAKDQPPEEGEETQKTKEETSADLTETSADLTESHRSSETKIVANAPVLQWDPAAMCEIELSMAEDSPFDQLPKDVMEVIESRMHPQRFAKGEYLMRQGEPGNCLMVLLEGQVEVVSVTDHGEASLIARTDACQVYGEMALLSEEPRMANVIALTPVVVNVLPAESFHELVTQMPEISVVLTKLIAQRVGRSGRKDVMEEKSFGGYTITGRLGRGGMAVVYLAHDPEHNRKVALKMMSHRLVYDQAALDQFQWEADIIKSFEHPNITQMYGRFRAFHTFFTVMQFCDGITLRDLIKLNDRLPEPLVRSILGQIVSALKYAHSKGIVHRDIKPANVMVNRDGTVMLMDFGLAKPADDSQSSLLSLIVGTPRYMAPEQMVGVEGVDQKSDYFALGCVIYEMLVGEPLIPETDWLSLLRHHADWELPNMQHYCPGLSAEVEEVLKGCLQSEPDLRSLPVEELEAWANPIDVSQLKGFDSI